MSKRIYNSWKPEDMEEALIKLRNNEMGFNEAHRTYNIPKPTLRRHLRELNTHTSFGRPKDLTKEMERELVEHVLRLERFFFGLTVKDLRKLAYQLAEKYNLKHRLNRTREMAGKNWYYRFMKDNPSLALRIPEATSMTRATAFNKERVYEFFGKYEQILEQYNFSPNQIYSMDETGLSTVHKPSKIIAARGKHQVDTVTSGERGMTTTCIRTMNAAGEFVPPVLIFKRARMDDYLKSGAPPGSVFACSKSGWITSELFLQWLKHFIAYTRLVKSEQKQILFLLDGHSSHTKNIDAIILACEYGIVLLSFPSHTTHRLQPLDLSFFKFLKTYYNEASAVWLRSHPGETIKQSNVSELLGIAYTKSARMEIAMNGFKCTGLWPCNKYVFRDDSSFAMDSDDNTSVPKPTFTVQNTECEIIDAAEDPKKSLPSTSQVTSSIDIETLSIDIITDESIITLQSNPADNVKQSLNIISPVPFLKDTSRKRASTIELTSSPYKDYLQKCGEQKETSVKRKIITGASNKKKKNNNEWYCTLCDENRKDNMIQCLKCKIWMHDKCAEVSKKVKKFICTNCK
ncbi:uncharacterized protein LOC100877113 [Megachile rotundata]|uniref:uncharacterized protein LOC100877113 n=1 Tax=Megachile rotundata TaxID=143995 RepID=UPI000614F072|nr:PREDICTED: jerky protein homolog-like [Megachile rotundata]XP_012148642.1 PREDICTED: jerky protein homolog-like [Megachile rotundata]XP_012148643.1 PREDICTED: jerky protein homolog-like [Megachile rotundata]XP_012148644.1 PREDICTED: jerky protein homolog-like [Megachile rotundata]